DEPGGVVGEVERFLAERAAAAEAAGVRRVVHVSSLTTLIGRRRTREPITVDETTRLAPEEMLGPYPLSKHRAEAVMEDAGREAGLEVVVAIPTLPLGPGDRGLTGPTKMLLDLLEGRTPATVSCLFDFIDVGALADALIAACEKGAAGERYILGGAAMEMSEFLAAVTRVTGVKTPSATVPYWVAYLAGAVDEWMATNIRKRPPTAPLTGVRTSGRKVRFDASKAKRELGLSVPPFEETLKSASDWLAAEGYWRRS
ncbi:MAG: NAD-dependent epimerase/dehydratase family protein, partial [Pseudomonadota bacterium]